jgi:MFS family permease
VVGYVLVALALVVFVQCSNVYPQLLLARLLFSFGGAAASTMVTAILPSMSSGVISENPKDGGSNCSQEQILHQRASADVNLHEGGSTHAPSLSVSSELTITPALYQSHSTETLEVGCTGSPPALDPAASSSKIAGFVGMLAGSGALLALVLFLPLPERFQNQGHSPELSLKYSYYIVAVVALLVSIWCLGGLRGLHEEVIKLTSIIERMQSSRSATKDDGTLPPKQLWKNFQTAIMLGFRRADIGLGYVGGFVARASSVGISLFVPLLVNALFRSSGLCGHDQEDRIGGLPDLKEKCSQGYILAAELTGASQLVALLSAPLFGYASAKLGGRQGPLMFASVAGIIGYLLLATRFSIDTDHQKGSAEAFLSMCLIGISQIGAIVCSLGILSGGVLKKQDKNLQDMAPGSSQSPAHDYDSQTQAGEDAPLIARLQARPPKDLSNLKGSIAGIYSLYGGAGILLLTKLGGLLFDRVSFGAPFYIMAAFNGILLLVCILVASQSFLKPGHER